MSEHHASYYEAHAEQVNAAEQQILKEHEPLIDFRVVDSEGISQGRQSRVSVLEYERSGKTFQVLWKRMAVGKELTAEEATTLQERLQPYRQSLEVAGWKVPKILYTRVCEMPQEYQIFSYEQFIPGGDGEKLYSNSEEPNFRKWYVFEEIIRTLYEYPSNSLSREELAGKELTKLPHGLDLKLANYVLEQGSNDLYFVDLFGPKELDSNGDWMTFSAKLDTLPAESLMALCATREGAILRCWRLAEKHWPNSGRDSGGLRSEFVQRLKRMNLPEQELCTIVNEIEHNYPWLDSLYEERSV